MTEPTSTDVARFVRALSDEAGEMVCAEQAARNILHSEKRRLAGEFGDRTMTREVDARVMDVLDAMIAYSLARQAGICQRLDEWVTALTRND